MDSSDAKAAGATDESPVRSLYEEWLRRWNERDASALAELVAENGNVVGFDGSQMNGRAEVAAEIGRVFANHATAKYIGIIREVRFLSADVALLRGVVGMMPPGQADINPAVNAIQALVAVEQQGQWRIALFQNTPAAFHGRPELSAALTEELRQALRAKSRA